MNLEDYDTIQLLKNGERTMSEDKIVYMKEMELRKHAKCDNCHERIMAAGIPLFYRLKVQRFGVLMPAVQRNAGLAQFFGGNAMLANVMGADEDMAQSVSEEYLITLCEKCSTQNICIPAITESKQI